MNPPELAVSQNHTSYDRVDETVQLVLDDD